MSTSWSDSNPCPSCGKGWDSGQKVKCNNCNTLQCYNCCNEVGSGIGGLGKCTWCNICSKQTETELL